MISTKSERHVENAFRLVNHPVNPTPIVWRVATELGFEAVLSDGKLELSVPVGCVPLAISLVRLRIVLPSAQPSRPASQRAKSPRNRGPLPQPPIPAQTGDRTEKVCRTARRLDPWCAIWH